MTRIIGAPTLQDALRALAETVRGNEAAKRKTVVFCEDRLTLLAERTVASLTGGTFLTEVTTFARFLAGETNLLSKQGSVMAVSAILGKNADKLRCFKRSAAQTVYETIAQLAASRADAELLKRSAQETDGMLSHKLTDLALVYEEYRAFLSAHGLLDENGFLALLPQKIEEKLAGCCIVFFAFPSFTRQALEGVRAAMKCADVTGVFLAGRGPQYTNEAARLFRRAAEETGGAEARFLKSSLAGDARLLADGLFSPDVYGREKRKMQHVRMFRAEDETEEMRAVCSLIRRHVAEDGARYRDFVLLLPGKERFYSAESLLSAYGIPFFSDRKRPFSEHPFSQFALAVLTCAYDGGLPESADAAAANYYFGSADNYRNYLLKYGGYRGAVNREIKTGEPVKEYDREELCACRDRLRAMIGLFKRKAKGGDYVAAVRALYGLCGGEEKTQSLAERFTGAEREFLSAAPLENVLGEIGRVAGEETFTALEFKNLLESGLSALEISMIPQSLDAVFVGDATESRFPRAPYLFAVGLDDSLPRVTDDTAVISDGEIERLHALSLEIEPAIATVNRRAREGLFLNLISFERELYLGCPLRVGGEEARRSEALLSVERMAVCAPMPPLFPYDSCEKIPAVGSMLRYKEEAERGRTDPALFSALYAALKERGENVDGLLSGGEKPKVGRLSELCFSGEISPTLLESYFSCPYAGFAMRGLKLRRREERSVLDTDTGVFVHTVLERVAPRFNGLESEEVCRAEAEREAETLLESPRYAALCDTDAGSYAAKRLISECGAVTAACFRQLRGSAFRVLQTEKKISIPSLNLGGRTDRVDVSDDYIRVIDYKTGAIDDAPLSYYTGRRLQLELYLLGASEGKIPAGAFYFPAQDDLTAGEEKYRMKGFFMKDDEVLSRMDAARTEGKSAFYEGGGRSEKGMERGDFEAFLSYALLVSQKAAEEMKGGNIAPSPYGEACAWCDCKGMCGFAGVPRREESVTCADVVGAVRRAKGEA